MKRRIWDSKSKARIVLEGLQGRSVASLCSEYQITQSMYYRWRDTFLANAAPLVASPLGTLDTKARPSLAHGWQDRHARP